MPGRCVGAVMPQYPLSRRLLGPIGVLILLPEIEL